MQSVERWNSQWKAEQVAEIEQLRSVNLDSLTDAQFDAHLARALAFGDESLRRHFELTMPIATVAQLAFFCHETLGWDDGEVIKLLSGLSVASTEPARALSALAEMAAQRPVGRCSKRRTNPPFSGSPPPTRSSWPRSRTISTGSAAARYGTR